MNAGEKVGVPMRWRHLAAGDTFTGRDGTHWHVEERRRGHTHGYDVQVRSGERTWRGPVDPDEVVTLLVPPAERDAAEALRTHLGARLIERRAQ